MPNKRKAATRFCSGILLAHWLLSSYVIGQYFIKAVSTIYRIALAPAWQPYRIHIRTVFSTRFL